MNKFYVQSGNLKVVLLGASPIDAAVRAIRRCEHDHTIYTSDIFTVSQQGFVLDREDFSINSTEIITLDEILKAMQ